jgi:hypothetical protein
METKVYECQLYSVISSLMSLFITVKNAVMFRNNKTIHGTVAPHSECCELLIL